MLFFSLLQPGATASPYASAAFVVRVCSAARAKTALLLCKVLLLEDFISVQLIVSRSSFLLAAIALSQHCVVKPLRNKLLAAITSTATHEVVSYAASS